MARTSDSLSLAGLTVKTAPPRLGNPHKRRFADFTGLPFAAINVKAMLEIAQISISGGKIPQGGPARLNGFRDHIFDVADKRFGLSYFKPACRAAR